MFFHEYEYWRWVHIEKLQTALPSAGRAIRVDAIDVDVVWQ